jgi:ribosome-associated protein
MIVITPDIRIPDDELAWTFARSGGPGGQNVNKVSSKVLLRWNPAASVALPADVKGRLLAQQRHRLTNEGDLLITSQKTRDQAKNIADCEMKLVQLVVQALRPPKVRRPTKPTRGSQRRRVADKQHRGRVKAGRKAPGREE